MAPLKSCILATLNSKFRPPGKTLDELFPSHEFDATEARQLAHFCDRISVAGYDFIWEERNQKELQDILDLAAEYGAFVDDSASPWYLGIFVIAEFAMEPFASESFCSEMFRSAVFKKAPQAAKDLAAFLMFLAIFCERRETAAKRIEEFLNAGKDACWDFSNLSMPELMSQLTPDAQLSKLS